jgi:feruloyl esterase
MDLKRMNAKKICFSVVMLVVCGLAARPAVAASCESLSGLKLADTTITSAQIVAAGAFIPPGATVPPASVKNLPAFCRVTAEIKPAKDSDIKIEVWVPITGWNGKYRGQGTGGFAGQIDYPGLAVAVSRGYASASTDTGHAARGTDATWALGHPDKITDFGYRAIHEMTVKAKAIIKAFYGEGPRHSYFAGCSNGGRQALMEAQRFPDDYDGIMAGAPANYWTRVFATFIWDIQALQQDPASYIPARKVSAIASAVAAACDAHGEDGVKDDILNDPRECHFDPATIVCKAAESDSCLTAPQAAALQKIYAGPKDAKGKQIFPGFLPGGENGPGGWFPWVMGAEPGKELQTAFASGFFTNMISTKEPMDLKTADVESAVKIADEQQGKTLNATDPNLRPFLAHGGKLVIYHGWSDAALPPVGAINYFNSVELAMGRDVASKVVRLYMVPGMQHCAGGPGPSSFGQNGAQADPLHDIYAALEQWLEKGTAPDKIITTKYISDSDHSQGIKMTRPLCPYPQAAKYNGTGDTNDAANFACVAGKK